VVIKVKEESVYEQYYAQEKQKGIDQGAVFTYLNHDTLDIKSQEEMCKKAKTLLGARIAERLITHSTSTFFGWKKNSAFNMIKSIVADGIDLKSLSKSGQNALSDEAQNKLKEHERAVEELLLQHLPALHALTDALQSKQTLTINEITTIISKAESAASESSVDQIDEAMAESVA
jgi:ATP-dependent Zn protease